MTGAPGAGKTALIKEISEVLYRADEHHAVVDLDELCRGVFPASAADFGLDLAIENLAAVWSNFKRRGVRRLVAARIVQSADELVRISSALPDCEFTICRLTAAPAVLESRIHRREAGSSAPFLSSVVQRLAQDIDAIEFPMITVDNGPQASIIELANQVLRSAGWPSDA